MHLTDRHRLHLSRDWPEGIIVDALHRGRTTEDGAAEAVAARRAWLAEGSRPDSGPGRDGAAVD